MSLSLIKNGILYTILMFLINISSFGQTIITIGNGITYSNSGIPMYGYYGNGWSQQIYKSSEINTSGTITKIAYQVHSGSNINYTNQKIYIKESSASSFTSYHYVSPVSEGATLVYNGSITYTNGWVEITLQTPFVYSGTNNLIIYYENRYGSNYNSSYPSFYVNNVSNQSLVRYYYNSSISYAFNSSYGYSSNYRNNIKLTISTAANDLSVVDWVYPTTGTNASQYTPIILKVKNVGTSSQSNFPVKYSIDNGNTWATTTYTSTIGSNNSVNISFGSQMADMSSPGVYRCIGVVSNSGDTINNNDTLRRDITICGGSYSGTYTIGSDTSNDFPSIASAISSIETCGINGPVTFKIQSGIYNEQLHIKSIYGLSSSTPITFTSFTGNPDDVIFKYAATQSNDNYVLSLDTCSYITIKNITFKALGVAYSNVAKITNSTHCTLDGNKLISKETTATSTNQCAIYIVNNGSNANNNLTIKNNKLLNGSYSIYSSASSSTQTSNNKIINNDIGNFNNYCVYITYDSGIKINSNKIHSPHSANARGIYLYQCTSIAEIMNNKINLESGICLYSSNSSGSSSQPAKFANNFLTQSLSNSYTVYLYKNNYINLDFNSINLSGSSSGSSGLYIYNGNNLIARNNNIINNAGGRAFYNNSTSNFYLMDYNNYYTSGSYLAYWGGNSKTTLNMLQNASNMDSHSLSNNVTFYTNEDLHISGSSLNNMGTPVSGITEDIDGQTRNTSTPDIGADEYSIYSNDAGIISFQSLSNTCPGTAQNIIISLKNFGTSALTNVTFGVKINGSNATAYNWSGLLGALNSTNATVSSYNFSGDTIYNIKVYIKTVNNSTDSNAYNDTLEINNYHTSFAGGTYIIGNSASADFSDISSAINSIKQHGICGPIVFKIENGTYIGNYTLDNSITGLSNTNTITFESLSGDSADVFLEYNANSSSDAYIFYINATSYITFKNLSFNASSTSYCRSININQSNHININACFFTTNKYNGGLSDYYSNISILSSNHITIENSTLVNAGSCIYSIGTSSVDNSHITIKNNTIDNYYRYGIYNYYTGDSLIIDGNYIQDRQNSSYNSTGVYASNGDGFLEIKNNIINLLSVNVSSGIYLYYQNYYNPITNGNNIYNNFINIGNTTSNYKAIYLRTYNTNVYYNTIKTTSTNTSAYGLYCYYNYNLNSKNNNFDMGVAGVYYIYYGSITSSDYNNFNSTNTSAMRVNGYYRSIPNHISNSGYDSHSKNISPNYVSSNDFHLHDNYLNNVGTPINGITTDIDGDTRSSTPDIGADEYDMLSLDIELYAINKPNTISPVGSNDIRVAIKNMGTSYIVLDSLHYQIDNGSINSSIWTGYLAPLSVDSFILIGTETLNAGNHTIKAWSSKPNNNTDQNPSNDTLTMAFTTQVMPSILVSPTALFGTITTCNDSITIPLVIKNIGGDTLTGNIDGAASGTGNTQEIVLLTWGSSSPYYTNLVNVLGTTFTNYNLTYSNASTISQLQAALVNKDVVIMPYMSTSSYISNYLSFASTFQNFVSNGGSMIFTGQYSGNYAYVTNTGLWSGTNYSGYSNYNTLSVANHPITSGLNNSSFTGASDYFFYYSGTPSNYTSLISYGSYQVAGIRNYGNGHVVYLGFRYSDNNQPAIGQLVSNTLGYLFNQNSNWLHNTDTSFTVAPGDSTIINYVFSGDGLENGSYFSSIELTSNDIGNPTVIVPCTMVVAGPPSISVSSNSVSFSSSYVNIASYDTLEVYNNGCGNLIFSTITTTNTSFSSTYHTDTIIPGDTGIIVYKFLTSTPGAYSASSTIYSNTNNYNINLAANATNPPAIAITPNPINITITNCNDSITTNLQIQNTGGGTLTATVTKTKDTVDIIILTYGSYNSYLNNLIASLGQTYSKYNYTLLNTTTGTTLQTQIAAHDADVIIIPYINSSYSVNSYSNLATTLQNFTSAGGMVIFAGQYYSSIFSATGLITGSRVGGTDYATLYTQNTSDPITLNFPNTYSSSTDDFNYYSFSGSNITSLVKYSAYDMVVKKQYGAGLVVVIGHYYNSITQNRTKALLSNSIKLASEQGADWIQFTTSTANLSAGSSAIKAIKFNAAGLTTGTYTSSIKVSSNAPNTPVTYIPCTLHVLNQMANGVNLGADTTHCGAITLNAGSYSSFIWNTGNTTQTISAVSTGTYSVTVSNGGNCQSSDTISVTINPIPSISLTGLPTSGCTNGTAITLNASPSGGVFAGQGISAGTFNPAAAGVGVHTIFYSYTNIYNCTNTASQQITIYNPPTVTFSGLNSSYCPQGTASVLNGSPSGGTFSGNGIIQNNFVPSVAGIGTHQITYSYSDIHNCSNSDTQSTTIAPSSLSISFSGYQSDYCEDASLDTLYASPSGGVFSGPGMNGNIFDPGAANIGTQYIKYTKQDANSCYITDSIAITVHSLPSGLSISGLSQALCANDASISLGGYPAGGVFSGLGINGNNFNPTTAGSGNHTITYTYSDNFGCTNSTSQTAIVYAIPVITFTNLQNQYCENDASTLITATPIGGTLSGNELNGNTFDPNYSGIGSFWVFYEYTNTNSCYNKDSFNITVNPLPSVSISNLPTSLCSNGNTIPLSGTPVGGIFSGIGVNGNQFNPSQSTIGTQYIKYEYTDNNGCSNADSSSISIIQVHSVNAGNDTTISYNTSTQMNGLVIGGSGSFNFSWAPSSMVTNASQLSPNTVNLTNSTLFTLTVGDNTSNCSNSDQVLVTVSGGPLTATASASPSTICAGENTQLLALGSGGSSSYSYLWSSNPTGFNSTLSNPIFSPSISTTFTCVIDDGNDTLIKNIFVNVNPSPQVSMLNLNGQYCNNTNTINVQVSPSGGVLTGNGINGLTFNPATASLGTNTIIYSVTNSFNCFGADTQIVNILSAPSAYAGEDTLLPCLNGGVALGQQPVNGVSYQWFPNIALSNDQIANPMSNPNLSINYTLQATNNSNNCIAYDTIHIMVTGAPTAKASNDTLVCANSPVVLTATGGDTYFWSNGALGDTITVTPSVSTLFYVIVSHDGCSDLDTVFVNISDAKPHLGSDTTICASTSINLDAGAGFISYQWSTNENTQIINVDSNGIGLNTATFIVEVVDTINCTNSDTIAVTFEDCTSLNNIDNKLFTISIYPNPSKGKFIIQSNNTDIQRMEMSILNSTGKLISNKTISNKSGIIRQNIDLSTYPKGIYFIKLYNNGAEKSIKVIIQ